MNEAPRYTLLQRSRDKDVGVVHLKDVLSGYLSLCRQGYAETRIDMDVKHTAVPTCVFCVADVVSGLKYWKLYAPHSHYRRVVEHG